MLKRGTKRHKKQSNNNIYNNKNVRIHRIMGSLLFCKKMKKIKETEHLMNISLIGGRKSGELFLIVTRSKKEVAITKGNF